MRICHLLLCGQTEMLLSLICYIIQLNTTKSFRADIDRFVTYEMDEIFDPGDKVFS